ncbi:hypothetical protein GCM10010964_28970 [Caldovatus sediminis]|uniref:Tripartite tricarboxylate transporter substrate binding protein n=1 Tax=Caldovatus sediminis TaxID=2041189 RepID=A0A8J3ED47_9PROT|nr:tripartite tricarboxylate transporter substrate binding protein [Caldovatus sediminis]GGG39592.1 hypothetical protein GCM10010964_28970 [Caldovatus sediminis]
MSKPMAIGRRAIFAALSLAALPASAQTPSFPARTVTLLLGFPPGGTVDLLARLLAPKLSEAWGQSVVVENRPGGSGVVATQALAGATPDGHTLMVVPMTHATNPALIARIPFDSVADFTPISLLAESPIMLVVNQNLPARGLAELVSLARERPGRLHCGSGGNGTSQHLACELFKQAERLQVTHVPYRGNAAAMTDVISGQIEMLFDQMATAVPHVRAGRVRALAVTSARRSSAMPDVPTMAELGVPQAGMTAWFGLIGPARMAPGLVARIQADTARILAAPEMQARLGDQGLTVIAGPPAQFAEFLAAELQRWGEVVRVAGIRAE